MSAYGQYCPIAKAADIFAERWTPLIIREMVYGVCRFNELERGLPGIPRSLLAQRLRRLEAGGVVERRASPGERSATYHLTPAGQQLETVIEALGTWGAQYAFADPEPEELDPLLLLWWMKRRVIFDALPQRRVVIQIDLHGFKQRSARPGTYWLVMQPQEVSLCLQHPGFDVDLLVDGDLTALYRIWFGRLTFAEALHEELILLHGPAPLVRAFPSWFALSTFAATVRAASASTASTSTEHETHHSQEAPDFA
ncbi:MAG TPA: helix-turn-helix domain-containing protein [Ktedonobacterales bacterium]